MKLNITYKEIIIVLIVTIAFSGCSMKYSFTGASIPPEVKSINIKYFPNNALLIEPTLSQTITDGLRDKFTSETSLEQVNNGGDLLLEGAIIGYRTTPVAIQGDDQAALNRLTITLEVTFINTFDETMSFENTKFERYLDYSSSQNLSEVQETLVAGITEMLIVDIFNKAVINW